MYIIISICLHRVCVYVCVHARALISSIVMVVFVIAMHCLIGTELLDIV